MPVFSLAYLANGFTRNVTGAAGFARALEKAVSNKTLRGGPSPPAPTGTCTGGPTSACNGIWDGIGESFGNAKLGAINFDNSSVFRPFGKIHRNSSMVGQFEDTGMTTSLDRCRKIKVLTADCRSPKPF